MVGLEDVSIAKVTVLAMVSNPTMAGQDLGLRERSERGHKSQKSDAFFCALRFVDSQG